MARGWESKAVADQIEDTDSNRREQQQQSARTAEERQIKERLTSLKLSRSHLLQQLERATHPRYREGLQKGLKAIEAEIEELSDKL